MTPKMNTKTKMTVAIPTHGMENAEQFFRRCMDSLWNQTFQDFEIVVSDNSEDDVLKNLCEDWYRTGVRYLRNPIKGMAPNTNHAMRNSGGNIIKILYMDDFMAHDGALENIYDAFDKETEWLVTACTHVIDFDNERFNPHRPSYNPNIHIENTIGSPSVLAVRNRGEGQVLFDEKLTWLLDADLYRRLHAAYGEPTILNDLNVVIGRGLHQMTHQLSDELKSAEHEYSLKKHA